VVVRKVLKGRVEIAACLKCHPDTITRWARTLDFPLIRMPNGGVCTTTTLIAAWYNAQRQRELWG
jgi:hypothetical protein